MIVELTHSGLAPAVGRPLHDPSLADRERVAVVFQATALLAHLETAGWRLAAGWCEARVGAQGTLSGLRAVPGRAAEPVHGLLLEPIARLCGPALAGRGTARRLLRACVDRWSIPLAPLALDLELARLAAEAEFLFSEPWGAVRRALVSWRRDEQGRESLWVAGPPAVRHRLLRAATRLEAMTALLESREGAALWWGADGGAGLRPEAGGDLAAAEARYRCGEFERALREAGDLPGVAAGLLRAACQRHLGRFAASATALRRLRDQAPRGEVLAEALDLATVVHGNLGEPAEVDRWLRLGRSGLRGALAARAELAAAEAALDRGELSRMAARLAAARPALEHPHLAWRWHRVAGELAQASGSPDRAVQEFAEALRRGRRRALPFEAGRLWVGLGNARSETGDLAGAERALAHAARLLGRCEGPVVTTLALFNLADVRLRRGRLLGVEQIVAASESDNERQGNLRGWAHDQELWARLELVRGRLERALERVDGALRRLAAAGQTWRVSELEVLAARGLGWLGRSEEAARLLEGVPSEAIRETLEPEERPALWALAGCAERAWAEAQGGPFVALWRDLLDGGAPSPVAWGALQQLEPYRAARLVLDCERLAPDCAPPSWQRRGRSGLHRVGAHRLAEWIGRDDVALWRAVERFAGRPAGEPAAVAALFTDAGEGGSRLVWEGPGGSVILLAGEAGDEELSAPCGEGTLRLSGPRLGAAQRALFALARRDFVPPMTLPNDRQPSPLIGASPALLAARERLARLAAGEMPVLLLGESGTGKELAARELHRGSSRKAGPFVPVNCAALSETLIHSDLFGHARGAFTGADRDRAGVFESARGGIVFLDEIGDLPLPVQGNLLRVLQEGEIRRLGESLPRRVDARVVAATHRDLAEMVRRREFREDLYFRLRVATVQLPPLRERGRDVLGLAESFLARAPGGPAILTREARAKLLAYPWPGNVRELQNVLTVAIALAADGRIDAGHLELEAAGPVAEAPAGEYHVRVETLRRRLIEEALAASGGRPAGAARRLGLTRQTLSYLMRRFGIRAA